MIQSRPFLARGRRARGGSGATRCLAAASLVAALLALTVPALPASAATAGTISTVAGGLEGTYSATSVAMNATAVALAGDATTYVADPSNDVVWAVDSSTGVTRVVAGDDSGGYSGDGGPATSAQLSSPSGVAVDSAGDVFIADSNNNVIRMVAAATCTTSCPYGLPTTAGDIYTVAGNGNGGYSGDGSSATSEELSYAEGVAVDSAGNLLIADIYNERIRMVAAADCSSSCPYGVPATTAGYIYTVAGGGGGAYSGNGVSPTSGQLSSPEGVAVDPAGNLLIADTGNDVVRMVAATTCASCAYGMTTTAGDIYTVAGGGSGAYSGDGVSATSGELASPRGVAADSNGNLLIADTGDNVIRMVAASTCTSCAYGLSTTAGDIYTVAGTGTGGYSGDGSPATSAEVNSPEGVAADSNGNLIIADAGNSRVRLVAAGTCSSSCAYGLPSTTARDVYTVAGNGFGTWSGDGGPAGRGQLSSPDDVVTDSTGDLFISDMGNNDIRMVAAASCSSSCPFGLSTTAGDIYTVAGDTGTGRSGSGVPATSVGLNSPAGLAVDSAGDLFIANSAGQDVLMVAAGACADSCPYGLSATTAGDIYTVAGQVSTQGYSGNDGPATSAELNYPSGVAVDSVGNLLIADTGNNVVRMVAAATCHSHCAYGTTATEGDIYTVAGDGGSSYSGDGGQATAAQLNGPAGLAVDSAGDLFIADTGNNVIRMVAAATCTSSCPYGLSTTADDIYTVAGDGNGGYSGDGGPATLAQLNYPQSVALDSAGDVLISDSFNNVIRMVAAATCTSSCPYGLSTTADDIYTVAGDGTAGYSGDGGPAASAEVSFGVGGVALDPAGDLFIADTANNRVRAVAASSSVAASTSVTSVSFSPVPSTAGTSSTWTVGFTTSSSGSLGAGTATITLTAPVGTAFPLTASDYSVNGTPVSAPPTQTEADNVTITVPAAVADSASVSVVADNVTNPGAASDPSGDFSVDTSSDTTPATPGAGVTFIAAGGSDTPISPTSPSTPAPTTCPALAAGATSSGCGTAGSGTGSAPVPVTNPPGANPPANACAAPTADAAFVCQAYHDLLGRAPDAAGLSTWTEALGSGTLSRTQVATGIMSSAEYRADLVRYCYEWFLGRAPSSSETASWVAALGAGQTDEALTAAFVGSAELYSGAGSTPTGFLSAAYHDLLGRAPDPAGLAAWQRALAHGMSRPAVAAGIIGSEEYQADEVAGWYSRYLGRSAKPAEISAWVSRLRNGLSAAAGQAGVIGSPEYLARAGG